MDLVTTCTTRLWLLLQNFLYLPSAKILTRS